MGWAAEPSEWPLWVTLCPGGDGKPPSPMVIPPRSGAEMTGEGPARGSSPRIRPSPGITPDPTPHGDTPTVRCRDDRRRAGARIISPDTAFPGYHHDCPRPRAGAGAEREARAGLGMPERNFLVTSGPGRWRGGGCPGGTFGDIRGVGKPPPPMAIPPRFSAEMTPARRCPDQKPHPYPRSRPHSHKWLTDETR